MPRRFSANTRAWIYRFLVLRDGEKCSECGRGPAAQNTNPATQNKHPLEVDHIDGNPRNNDPDNLRFLCKSCNVKAENKSRSPSASFVCVNRRMASEGNTSTRVVKDAVMYSQGSAEMKANDFFEVDFRNWVLGYIRREGFILATEAENSGAEIVGCSVATASRYIRKLASIAGPLQELTEKLKGRVLVFKDHLDPELNPELTVNGRRNGKGNN